MSKKRKPRPTQRTADSYSNPLARLGAGQLNMQEFAEYPLTRRTQDYQLMLSLYRNDWIAGRIVDTVAEDMCKNWYRLASAVSPERMSEYQRTERRAGVKPRLIEALKWSRLFGGAAALMVLDGQEDLLDTPLDLRLIMPGTFKGLIVADRWSGVYPSSELVSDMSAPDFGLPKYYQFAVEPSGPGIRVHHSRILRFTGRELSAFERQAEQYWGLSELEHVYEELTKRNSASANIAQLIFQSNLRVFKMSDLGQLLTATSPEAQQDLYRTLEAQNAMMSNMGIQLMDREDSFETHSYSFNGLSDIYELFMMDIAGAAEIPVTKLFGRSPAGLNATGESDLTNYYDMIAQKQEAQLRPALDRLVPVLSMSTWGAVPEDLDYEFMPVRVSTDKERSELIERTSKAIGQLYDSGVISKKTALRELRLTESATGMWRSLTEEEIDRCT